MKKILSIITINYNNAEGLLQTILSVVAQKTSVVEFIIIDGYSKDTSLKIIKENESSIDFYISEKDFGIYDAMNKGIKKSNGEFLLFLNSGDTLYNNNVLQNILPLLNQTQFDIIYGKPNIIFKDGKSIILEELPEKINLKFLLNSTLNHQSTFIKRNYILSKGLYNTNNKYISDYDFFLNAFTSNPNTFKYYNIVIANYHLDGLSSKPENMEEIKQERIKIQLKYFSQEIINTFNNIHNIEQHKFYWILQKSNTNKFFNFTLKLITQLRTFTYKLIH